MIAIRHEGSGPYVERTIVEWNGSVYIGEVECLESILEDCVTQDLTADSVDDLRTERDNALEALGDAEKRVDELEEQVSALEADLDEHWDEADPKGCVRERLADWRKQALRTAAENKRLRDEVARLQVEVKQGRARTCTICSKWSQHDDRGYCTAHGKPIKGLALKRRKAAA